MRDKLIAYSQINEEPPAPPTKRANILLLTSIRTNALCGVVTMSGFSDSHEEGYSPVPPIRLLQCILTVANSSA